MCLYFLYIIFHEYNAEDKPSDNVSYLEIWEYLKNSIMDKLSLVPSELKNFIKYLLGLSWIFNQFIEQLNLLE